MHRSERVMRRVPALLFLVPLEHRKIDYPEELEIARIEQLVPVLKLLRAKEAELPASLLDRFFGAMALGFAGRGSQNQEIVFAGGAALPHAVHSGWMVPLQTLHIIVNAEPALLSEGFQLIALFSTRNACPRQVNRDQRHSGIGEIRQHIPDGIHRRNSHVGLVASVAAHGLGISEARKRIGDMRAGGFADAMDKRLDNFIN